MGRLKLGFSKREHNKLRASAHLHLQYVHVTEETNRIPRSHARHASEERERIAPVRSGQCAVRRRSGVGGTHRGDFGEGVSR